jgi:hypothetical protein
MKIVTVVRFYENPTCGSRFVACGFTEGRTGTKQVIRLWRHFATAHKRKNLHRI